MLIIPHLSLATVTVRKIELLITIYIWILIIFFNISSFSLLVLLIIFSL